MGLIDELESIADALTGAPKPTVQPASVGQAQALIDSLQRQNDAIAHPAGGVPQTTASQQSVMMVATASATPVQLPPGKALVFLREGSNPNLRIDVTLGNQTYTQVPPGERINGDWVNGSFILNPDCVYNLGNDTATAKLLIVNGLDIEEPNRSDGYGLISTVSYGGTAKQTNQQPTLSTQGATLSGIRACRFSVFTSGTFPSTGLLRIWIYSGTVWRMLESVSIPTMIAGDTTLRGLTIERLIHVPAGRVYLECYDAGQAGEANNITIDTWG